MSGPNGDPNITIDDGNDEDDFGDEEGNVIDLTSMCSLIKIGVSKVESGKFPPESKFTGLFRRYFFNRLIFTNSKVFRSRKSI